MAEGDSKGQTIAWAGAAAAAAPVLDSIVNGLFQNSINNKRMEFDRAEAGKQRAWNLEMWNKQANWTEEMWNKSNEYNTADAQVQRLRDAGLNPLYYGVDGVAAQPMSSPQVLGYERAQAGNLLNPYNGGIANVMNSLKDVQLKDAQIDKLKQDSTGVKLDNEFKDKTMKARVDAETLKNEVTKSQKEKFDAEKDQIFANIDKVKAETDNEILKGFLIQAETNLKNVQADEVRYLMEYKKLLMEAQTIAQKANASAQFVKAAIDQKLLKGGEVDALIEKAKAEAKSAEARRQIDEFKTAIHTGQLFDVDESDGLVKYGVGRALNRVLFAVSSLSEALIGPVSGIFK